jgi:hypothetical protein
MKKIQNLSTAMFLALAAGTAAASQQTGLVLDIRVSSTTLINPTHILLSGVWAAKPTCATSTYWAIDTDTTVGKNFLATILTAQASGRPITIYGSNFCSLRTDMETGIQIQLAK